MTRRRTDKADSPAHAASSGTSAHGDGAAAQESSAGILMSRRKFLYGAIGVGAAAAVVAGAYASASHGDSDDEADALEVPEGAVTTQEDLVAVEDHTERLSQIGEHDLPYGTLVWANSDAIAACLLPTETGSPLAKAGILALGTGYLSTVLESAVGKDDHFEIYDIRASDEGVIWTEANIMKGTWRIYTARLSGTDLAEPVLAGEGDATYDTPTIAAAGPYAFWQLLPKLPNDDGLPSLIMRAKMGSAGADEFFESARRMACAPYALDDSLVICPRLDMATLYYELACIDAKTGTVKDALTLPAGMRPDDIGYGDNGFAFTFQSIYNYENGISNLGTYTPMDAVRQGDYNAARWFGFARTPLTAPAWASGRFIVKSTRPVCAIDFKAGEYAVIDVEDGTDTYGEYLASSGVHDTFVTYSNIDHTPVDGEHIHACRVKVWQPL